MLFPATILSTSLIVMGMKGLIGLHLSGTCKPYGGQCDNMFIDLFNRGADTTLLVLGLVALLAPGTQTAGIAILLEVGGEMLVGAGLSGFQYDLGELKSDGKLNNLAWLAEVGVGGLFGAVDFGVGKALDRAFPAVLAAELSAARSRGAWAVASGPMKKVLGRTAAYMGSGALRGGASEMAGNVAKNQDVFHDIQYGLLYGAVTGGLKSGTLRVAYFGGNKLLTFEHQGLTTGRNWPSCGEKHRFQARRWHRSKRIQHQFYHEPLN